MSYSYQLKIKKKIKKKIIFEIKNVNGFVKGKTLYYILIFKWNSNILLPKQKSTFIT